MKRPLVFTLVGVFGVAMALSILMAGCDTPTVVPATLSPTTRAEPVLSFTPPPIYAPTLDRYPRPPDAEMPFATDTPLPPTPLPSATPFLALTTPFPPVVTKWNAFRGLKTGFSFIYPNKWYIVERVLEPLALMQNVLIITNYDLSKAPVQEATYPRGAKIGISNFESAFPTAGSPFPVGPQRLPGRRFVSDFSTGIAPSSNLARRIAVYFKAGGRNWIISAEFGQPKSVADKNTEFFYKIVGSLRYANR
ncbi:MAG: hypothetical protein HZB53_19175 [Chloroflexi bacterium]|nr:hypothetical protein [Chloroflexota bacterium]